MQNKGSNIKGRLAIFLKYKGLGQAKFAEIVGLSKGFANNVGDSIRTDNLGKISIAYPELNTVWLLTGVGEMLKSEDAGLVVSSSVSRIPENKLVPLYDFQTARDLMSGRVPKTMDYIYIPNISDCDGALYVRTNSMSPRIQTGDVVLFKMLHSKTGSYTINSFRWGDVYLILFCMNGDSSVVLKHIQKSDDDTLVKLANYDKKVDSYEIPIDSIKSLALVKGGVFYMAM